MPDSVTLTFRGITTQDFATNSSFAQITQTVLGVGPVLVTPLVLAASDAAATTAGVPLGGVYINNGGAFNYLKTRMT